MAFDGTVPFEDICRRLDESCQATKSKTKKGKNLLKSLVIRPKNDKTFPFRLSKVRRQPGKAGQISSQLSNMCHIRKLTGMDCKLK